MLAALAAILTAAACTAQVLPLSAPVNPAAPGSLPWRVLTWRDRAGATLRETPLRALRSASGSTLTSEWAPLYRGRDGVRVEQAQQLARFAERAGSLRMGAELRRDVGAFRGGKTRWGVDAAGEALRGGSLGLACVRSAMAIAAGASLSSDGRAGLALEGEVSLCPAWRASLVASQFPQSGSLDVHYEDRAIVSRGIWSEQRAGIELAGRAGTGAFTLSFESLDHRPHATTSAHDGLASRFAWRGVRAGYSTGLRGLRVAAELAHGEGRQRIELSRDDVAYAVMAGPVRDEAATLVLSPAHERWSVRMWAGENRASAAGALALWPFDGVAAAIGTRLAANGSFEMRHCGAALNGGPANKRGWDGGVALWALEPVGRYESWRGTLFGLGRDDHQVREVPSKRTLLAGIRVAYTMPVGKRTPRVEVVQWAPLSWPTTSQSVSAAAADPSAATSATLASGRTWGGTILRVSI